MAPVQYAWRDAWCRVRPGRADRALAGRAPGVKRLNATADTAVRASPAACLRLLEAVDRYPEWYPEVVRKVTVLARDAGALACKVEARLHVSRGPLSRDLELMLEVSTDEPLAIRLTRL